MKTKGAYISISKDKILVQGDKMVTVNGEKVLLKSSYSNFPKTERAYIDDGEGIYADKHQQALKHHQIFNDERAIDRSHYIFRI